MEVDDPAPPRTRNGQDLVDRMSLDLLIGSWFAANLLRLGVISDLRDYVGFEFQSWSNLVLGESP
jgi:hypothetical protein